MDDNIKISVIIPIYNGETYINRVLSSFFRCPIKNLEIILVNDGSTDATEEICNEIVMKEENISVVHKNNGGLSTARNAGLKIAKGKYVSFLDVDDYMDIGAYEKIIDIMDKFVPDIIDFGWKYIDRRGEVSNNICKIKKNSLIDRKYILDHILPPLLNLTADKDKFIYDFVCNKIFKMSIIKEHNISFDESRRTWEDRVFLVEYLKYANSYYSMDDCLYNYVDVPNSLSRRYDMHFFDIILDNYKKYIALFGKLYNFEIPYVNNYWSNSIENMILRSLNEKEYKKEIRHNIIDILKNPIVNHWFLKRKTMGIRYIATFFVIKKKPYYAYYSYKLLFLMQQVRRIRVKVRNKVKSIVS